MSRGFGRLERFLMARIERTGKPMTFDEIRAAICTDLGAPTATRLNPAFARSLRRALHRLTDKCMLIAMGDGGPGDPLRYFVHPLRIGMMEDKARADTLRAALEADPGAERAAAAWMVQFGLR